MKGSSAAALSELESVLAEEALERYFHYGPPTGTTANRVCLYRRDGFWELIITDERAVPQEGSRRTISGEAAASAAALRTVRLFAEADRHPFGGGGAEDTSREAGGADE